MNRRSAIRGTLIFLVGVLVGANAIYFLQARYGACDCGPAGDVATVSVAPSPDADDAPPAHTDATPVPGEPRSRRTRPAPPPATTPAPGVPVRSRSSRAGPAGLLVPVAGIEPDELSDTFDDRRGTDRIHEALDIMAPAGTAVLATADGRVEKLFDSANGGLTIYQFDPTGTWCYYYAHLQRYAPGLEEGDRVRRGQVIGFVGSSGNASPDAPHLHFGIFRLGPEKQWSKGTPVNPYPLLGGG